MSSVNHEILLCGLSILGMLFSIQMGFFFPKKAGWSVIVLAPVLGAATFTVVPSSLLPLTTYRVAFGVTTGIIARNYKNLPLLVSIFSSTIVKVVALLCLFMLVVSVEDRLKNVVFTYIPVIITSIALCYILTKDEKCLYFLTKIFVWQSAAISMLVLIDYFFGFDLFLYLSKTVPNLHLSEYKLTRVGFSRPRGIDGNPVPTSYRLVFYFPLTMWYVYSNNRFNILRIFPFILTIMAIIILQTRAAYIAICLSILILLFGYFSNNHICISRKMLRFTQLIAISIVGFVLLSYFFSDLFDRILEYMTKIWMLNSDVDKDLLLSSKIDRIPIAITHFLDNPVLGYGSPRLAYKELMRFQDIPAPLLYFLAGGIFHGLLYLIFLILLPLSLFRASYGLELDDEKREFLIHAGAAFAGGVIVVFSNYQESHFMVMLMLYASVYRVCSDRLF